MSRFGTRVRVGQPLAQWMNPRVVASVQRGTITIASGAASNTATILSVDPQRARVRWLGQAPAADQNDAAYARLSLTNGTTVTATRASTPAFALDVSYEVIEYAPGVIKSIQRGTITLSGNPTDATITPVNLSRAEVDFLGFSFNSTGEELTIQPRLSLQSATTVRANVATTGGIVGYQVVEWL